MDDTLTYPVPPNVGPGPSRVRSIIMGVVILVVIAALATAGYLFRDRILALLSRPLINQPFQGNLVLSFPIPWMAPDKEVFTGLASYDPVKNAFANMTIPQMGIIFNYSKEDLSPDGSQLLVMQVSATSTALAIYSIPLQKVTTVLDTRPASSQFRSMNWSGDGSKVSYMVMPTIGSTTLATDGKPFLIYANGKFAQRTGAQLPKSAQPVAYVISADGSHKILLGFGFPDTFSPDGSMVLVQNPGLNVFTLADGSLKAIARPTDKPLPTGTSTSLIYDPSGGHLGVLGKTGPLQLYGIDWKDAKLNYVGSTENRPTAQVFNKNGQMLSLEGTPPQVVVYSFGTTTMTRQAYSLNLATSSAQLLGWILSK